MIYSIIDIVEELIYRVEVIVEERLSEIQYAIIFITYILHLYDN